MAARKLEDEGEAQVLRIGGKLVRVRLEELGPGIASRSKCPTVADFSKTFMAAYARIENKDSTVDSKRSIFEHHLVPVLGARRLDQVGVIEIGELHAKLLSSPPEGAGLSRKTANNISSVLRMMLKYAVEAGVLERVPRIPHLKTQDPKPRWLSPDEARRLVDAGDDKRVMLLVALRTGVRIGELMELRWSDFDLDVRVLTVSRAIWKRKVGTPKGGRSRRIPLSAELVEALRAHPAHAISPYLFCAAGGEPWARNTFKRYLWNACKRAGLPTCGWHRLRHTFASSLVARGVHLRVIQQWLGHSTIAMTERYAHTAPDHELAAINLLDS